MSELIYDCNCDTVIEMQELDVGVEEILQYVRGIFSIEQKRALLGGIQDMVPTAEPVEQFYG